jgi:two-component system nitrogen regulation response regulator GlnG
MEKILVVDDDAELRRCFQRNLASDTLTIVEASNGEEAKRQVAVHKPDLTIMDIRMGHSWDGLETLQTLHKLNPKLLIIIMTDFGTTRTAIEAMKFGAYDYVIKSSVIANAPQLKALVNRALEDARSRREASNCEPLVTEDEQTEEIVGKSEPMQQVFKLIGQVSQFDATVLVTGESGTGKELVARAIYHHSKRNDQPFLAINCVAIPEQLLESELFGHERGAFTGAHERRIGKFEQCDGGTIFLDEIGDMPLATQAKVLRVLQNGEFQRVGGNQTLKVDVRVIAATNRLPEKQVAQKKFREDLYYRLNVVRIHLPPLRERSGDIRLLVKHFLQKSKIKHINPKVLEILQKYDWPGNVRELENVVERATVVARGETLMPDDLPGDIRAPKSVIVPVETVDATLDAAAGALFALARKGSKVKIIPAMEREMITRGLAETNGNQLQAAKLLGITRATLRKRIAKFGIERKLNVS